MTLVDNAGPTDSFGERPSLTRFQSGSSSQAYDRGRPKPPERKKSNDGHYEPMRSKNHQGRHSADVPKKPPPWEYSRGERERISAERNSNGSSWLFPSDAELPVADKSDSSDTGETKSLTNSSNSRARMMLESDDSKEILQESNVPLKGPSRDSPGTAMDMYCSRREPGHNQRRPGGRPFVDGANKEGAPEKARNRTRVPNPMRHDLSPRRLEGGGLGFTGRSGDNLDPFYHPPDPISRGPSAGGYSQSSMARSNRAFDERLCHNAPPRPIPGGPSFESERTLVGRMPGFPRDDRDLAFSQYDRRGPDPRERHQDERRYHQDMPRVRYDNEDSHLHRRPVERVPSRRLVVDRASSGGSVCSSISSHSDRDYSNRMPPSRIGDRNRSYQSRPGIDPGERIGPDSHGYCGNSFRSRPRMDPRDRDMHPDDQAYYGRRGPDPRLGLRDRYGKDLVHNSRHGYEAPYPGPRAGAFPVSTPGAYPSIQGAHPQRPHGPYDPPGPYDLAPTRREEDKYEAKKQAFASSAAKKSSRGDDPYQQKMREFNGTSQPPPVTMAATAGGEEAVLVEIAPGTKARLRRTQETLDAVANDFYAPVECFSCEQNLFCIADVQYFICPNCKVISSTELGGVGGNSFDGRPIERHGLGMGFDVDSLFRIQTEVFRLLN